MLTIASLFLEGQKLECQAGKLNNFSPLGHNSFFRKLQATESWCEGIDWAMEAQSLEYNCEDFVMIRLGLRKVIWKNDVEAE